MAVPQGGNRMTTTPAPPTVLSDYLIHFRRRTLNDALLEATSFYWNRRADNFDAVGNARCDEIAQACRNHATFVAAYGLDAEAQAVIDDILGYHFEESA
jgi:hypothetical protein